MDSSYKISRKKATGAAHRQLLLRKQQEFSILIKYSAEEKAGVAAIV
jgi:hypothetical protein